MQNSNNTIKLMHEALNKLATQLSNENLPDSLEHEVKTVVLTKQPVFQFEVKGYDTPTPKMIVGEKIIAKAKVSFNFHAEVTETW